MTARTEETAITIWVCMDCMQHLANGECGSCEHQNGDLSPHDREPLNLIEREPEGSHVSLGLASDIHECDRPDEDDCDCDTAEFSWSHCHGCGSTLGGSRHAATLFIPKVKGA